MDGKSKVAVVSTVKAVVGINVPDLRLKREWRQKGAKNYITFEDLEQALYDPGVEYMIKTGILYIDSMEAKIALGLEEETAIKPEKIIVLDDRQRERFLTVAPAHELKAILDKLSSEHKNELANYAIDKKISDMNKADLLKEATGIDVAKGIMLAKEVEAAEKAASENK